MQGRWDTWHNICYSVPHSHKYPIFSHHYLPNKLSDWQLECCENAMYALFTAPLFVEPLLFSTSICQISTRFVQEHLYAGTFIYRKWLLYVSFTRLDVSIWIQLYICIIFRYKLISLVSVGTYRDDIFV